MAVALLWLSTANAQMVLEYEIPTANTQIALPLNGTVNVSVNWGDGTTESFTTVGNKTHTYTSAGTKTVTITGTLTQFGNSGYWSTYYYDKINYLTKVKSWDGLGITSFSFAFFNASKLTEVPSTLPNTVTDLSTMFYQASSFNQPIGSWNTVNVTNMSGMFGGAYMFNQPIGTWNTINVTNMSGMFSGARSFNQSIGTWNTGNVTNMSGMFSFASSFNQPIGTWDTKNLTNMILMFRFAKLFNQPIGTWNTEKVTNMSGLFANASSFNQPIGTWNTSNVISMDTMFAQATSFNQAIGSWNITKVTTFGGILAGAGLCTINYDATLNGWATQTVKSNIWFYAGSIKYSSAGAAARAALISKGWSIYDGGLDTNPSNCGLVTETADVATSKPSNTAFPNPVAQGEVVNLGTTNVNYSILNASGVEVMKGTQASQIQTNTLPKGLYMLIINQSTQKLVVE